MKNIYSKEIVEIAMSFSWICGILETLGNLPERYFESHSDMLLKWAVEYVEKEEEDKVCFLKEKIKEDYREVNGY